MKQKSDSIRPRTTGGARKKGSLVASHLDSGRKSSTMERAQTSSARRPSRTAEYIGTSHVPGPGGDNNDNRMGGLTLSSATLMENGEISREPPVPNGWSVTELPDDGEQCKYAWA